MTGNAYRILIVGHGSIGQRHLRIIRNNMPSSKIMVLRHSVTCLKVEYADIVSASFDDVRAFRPQIAVVANPTSLHTEIAELLIDLDCHLLIEKPLSNSLEDAMRLVKIAASKSLVFQVGYNLRYLPSLRTFRDAILCGMVGSPNLVRSEVGQYLPDWRPTVDYRLSVTANESLGGGVLNELSHDIDYLYWIFGMPAWVTGWTGRVGDLEVDSEDTALVGVGFRSTTREGPIVASLNMDFLRMDATRVCTVIGTNGTLTWDAKKNSVKFFDPTLGEWRTIHEQPVEPDFTYVEQWIDFMRCVEERSTPLVPLGEALDVVKIISMVRSSANFGSKIAVSRGGASERLV